MPAPRTRPIRNFLRWIATIGFIVFALLLPSNLLWRYRLNYTHNAAVRAYDGCLAIQFGDGSRPMPLGLYYEHEGRPHIKWDAKLYPPGNGAWGLQVSLAFPIALFGLPAAGLWWLEKRDRRRALIGHCTKCGYDLKGLPAPHCPECGRGVSLPTPAAT
jgi:hypothetical protein